MDFLPKSPFTLGHADGRESVSPSGRAFRRCVYSVLVWDGIMGGNKTSVIVIYGNINAQTYINDVLAVEALPFIKFMVQMSPLCTIMPVHIQPQ